LTPNDPPAFRAREGAGPRHLVLHPNGKHAYLLNELDATVDLLAFDAQRGTLSLLDTWSTMPPGADAKPWAADLHLTPDGRFLYTSERNTSTLAIWAVSATTGGLTLVGHQLTEQQPRGFNIDPAGNWLLAVGQASGQLTVYKIDRATGLLEAKTRLAVGSNPNWVEIIELPPIATPPAPARSAA
jgi:6-phosphogluconolactonase